MEAPPPPSTSESRPSLRQRTTRGVLWVAVQAVTARGITLLQQIALAWLLAKSDFGLIGLTYTVTAFVNLMTNPGIDTVLVQRMRHFRHWATPAFWLGLALGVAGGVTLLLVAPVAAWAYGQPRLIGLISVLAIAAPLQALQVVPRARLQMQMRFRAVVFLGIITSVATALLTVAAAFLGMGAYSFVIPVPIVAAIVAVVGWQLARPPVRMELERSRWTHLFGKSMSVGGTWMLHTIGNQADYIALGLAGFADALIGTYVFAFNIAVQPLRLLSAGVPTVLFPGLSHLSMEPEKQVRATLRAVRLLALVVVPFCLLQVVLSPPIFRLLFPPRWLDSVALCQILTIGLMFNATAWPSQSLVLAQGRFGDLFRVTVIGTLGLLVALGLVIWLNPGLVSVAATVAGWHVFNSPFLHWAATRRSAPWNSYVRETYRPLLAGVWAAIACVILHRNLPATIPGDVIAVVAGTLVFTAIYALLILLIARGEVCDLRDQLAPLWARIWHSRSVTSNADLA
jgi:PST family polysaccharide transporter